jgi:Bacterial membrane protein YfhO
MKNPLLKKILPHLIAVVIFLIVSILFCKPVLEGNVLNQHDTVGWKGMAQNSFEYKEKNGHFPLWNPNLFSGMPNYQVAMEGKSVLPDMTKIFSLGMPKPINFFFLACICFYILCLALRIRPAVAILCALAYSFSTYNPVLVNAGHDTQVLATAFMPLLLAGLICTFEKKYWLGLALTTYATYQQIGVNHLQVSYYFLLVAIAITLSYLFVWIKNKEWKHIAIAASITVFAAIVGLAGNALSLMTTSEYAAYTMRGGKDITIEGDSVKTAKTSGLDTSYAFQYSLGKAETVTFLMPNAFGGASNKYSNENSHIVSKLTDKGIPESNAIQLAESIPKYWGLLSTSGPAYLGAIICLLGLIGFVIVKTPLRWGLLAATLLGILMSWGKYLPGFNTFLFEHLPMYNKFRSPAFAQVIPQFTITIIAALSLQKLLFEEKSKELLKADFKKILFTIGGLFALLGMMYIALDYRSSFDSQILANKWDNSGSDEIGRLILSGLKADRKAMFGGQILRALGFAILLTGVLYMYLKNYLKPLVVAIILIAISTLELTITSKEYLPEESYMSADDFTSTNFTPTAIDQQILQDKNTNYRVFNMAGDTYNESRTSYFHKSIGGYHPAKLRIYQDIIEKYLSAQPNPGVLNMLNAKYIIVQDPQSGQASAIPNPDAFDQCWLVKNVKLVDSRVSAIVALGNTNLKDTAIVEQIFSKNVVQPQMDSTSFIKMTKFDNDAIEYEANCNGPQFAVFSEIYYPLGWNAYVDGKKTDYVNANYILRGLSLPTGKHTVKFVFEPASVKQGTSIMFISSILILLIFVGGLFMAWRENNKKNPQEVKTT